jgi:hypothetical protein
MPSTYEPIATTTLGSATATITFSSIAATYTDLRLVLVFTTSVGGANVFFRFNGDTASNYSYTSVEGDGATATSNRNSSANRLQTDTNSSTTIPHFETVDVFSYAGSTNKTALMTAQEDDNGSGYVTRAVGLWRNTAAITSMTAFCNGANFAIGTTATLYGIKNF